jgi:hypothetical protein
MIINFEKAKRCQCSNISNISNIYICSNKSKTLYLTGVKLYCLSHYRYHFDSYATRIQSVYRGKRSRKVINTIYKRLPDDLQYIISYHIRSESYEKKYLKVLKTIIEKKISCLEDDMFNSCELINRDMKDYIINNEDSVLECCRLYNKYYEILDYNTSHKKIIIKIIRNLKRIIYDRVALMENFDIYETKIYKIYVGIEWIIQKSHVL